MPYKSIDELPKGVRHALPETAQHIFMEAFNKAYFEYAKEGGMRREITAFRVAWGAVKRAGWHKKDGKWVHEGHSSEHKTE